MLRERCECDIELVELDELVDERAGKRVAEDAAPRWPLVRHSLAHRSLVIGIRHGMTRPEGEAP